LLAAELGLADAAAGRRALAGVRAQVEEALRRAMDGGQRKEQALARRLLGRCAWATGDLTEAESYLRAALAGLAEVGVALEVARTRRLLAGVLLAAAAPAGSRPSPAARQSESAAEWREMLAEARVQFVASGAFADLAEIAEAMNALRLAG
jgi:hypothetical protein